MRRLVVCLVAVAGCWTEQPIDEVFSDAEWEYLQTFRLDHIQPIECDARCEQLARFGQQLFFDSRFSGPIREASSLGNKGEIGKVACTQCHNPAAYFVDTRDDNAQSLGTAWTKRNVPGLVDLAYRRTFIWSGKYEHIDRVLDLAVVSPAALNVTECIKNEMVPSGITCVLAKPTDDRGVWPKELRLVEHLDQKYAATYMSLFDRTPRPGNDLETYNNAAMAIAMYETQLVSGPSPFDNYLTGDTAAISDAAKRGAKLFIGKALCSECHSGPLFADDNFYVTGVEQAGLHVNPTDPGRADATEDLRDLGKFRTPSLRHIAKTAPYMHAGQHETLHDAIEFYRWGGDASGFVGEKDPRIVPLEIDDDDVADLEAFLNTLTGTPPPAAWTTKPVLP